MRTRYLTLGLCLSLLITGVAVAQTTGRIEGQVASEDGSGLPGVTITATSTQLQGNRIIQTAGDGGFRFINLPPGTYTVRAELQGFNTLEQQDVIVGIERTVTLQMAMSSAISDEVIVTSEAPVVDITSSSAGVNLSAEVFEELPLARDFYAVAAIAAGTGSDREGTTVYGATSVENQYVIDGLNTTGVLRGQEAKQLNVEFIQEVQVITGGLGAEHGRLTGGLINAITKSGGNEFKGDVFGYVADASLQADNSQGSKVRSDAAIVVDTQDQQDFGFDLGGYIVKDKLWFFAAFDVVEEVEAKTVVNSIQNAAPGTPGPGSTIETDIERDLFAGKLTWAMTQSQRFAGSIFADPTSKIGSTLNRYAGGQIVGPPSTFIGVRDSGGTDYTVRYDGIFGKSFLAEASAGFHEEEDKTDGPGKNQAHFIDQSVPGSPTSGGLPFHRDLDLSRDVYKASVSSFLGDHEIKFGTDLEELSTTTANWNGGAGQRIYNRGLRGGTQNEYRHRFFVDNTAPGFNAADPTTWTLLAPLVSNPETRNTSFFLQDTWRAASSVTINAGVRLERQEIGDRFGAVQADIDDNWAGRLGATWDVLGNGRSKLFANYGRYFLSIPMDVNIRAFGGEVSCFCYNFSADPNNITPDPNAPEVSRLLGAGGTPVDPALQGQFIDEVLVGFEYEVAPNFALGVQATYRDLGRVVEDFLDASTGNYFISNPGQGIGTTVTFYDYYFNNRPNGDVVNNFTAPSDGASREYKAVQLTARKRYSDNWQLLANYVWSELEGNYDGAFQVSTGQLDPTINSAFDYADFAINATGKLSLDREHQFRVDGTYRFDQGWASGLTLGASAYWKSGFPLNAYGYSAAYNNQELFLVERGSLGTGPDEYEIDLHFNYPVKISERYELNLLVDVFNVLDRQSITRLDERFNRPSDIACTGVDGDGSGIPGALCSNMGGIRNVEGTLDAAGQVDPSLAPNPDFHRLAAGSQFFTEPRQVRVGVRFSF